MSRQLVSLASMEDKRKCLEKRHTTVLVLLQAVCVAVIVLGVTLMHLQAAVIRSGVYAKHLLSIHFGGCGFPPPTALLNTSIT